MNLQLVESIQSLFPSMPGNSPIDVILQNAVLRFVAQFVDIGSMKR
jgi:hypothetical protein